MIFRFITGPTGSGKTQFAVEVAKKNSFGLINTDAFQFYREIPILSNQPQKSEIPFEYTASRSLTEPLNAGAFARISKPWLEKKVLWVGTGLYLGASLYGLDFDGRKGTPFQWEPLQDFRGLVLNPPRAELYENLNQRVDEMLRNGAIDEARAVLKLVKDGQIGEANPVLKAIGLKHLLQNLKGEISEERAIDLWKRDTRRLAKRQWTWLRKFCAPSEKILWLEKPHLSEALGFLK